MSSEILDEDPWQRFSCSEPVPSLVRRNAYSERNVRCFGEMSKSGTMPSTFSLESDLFDNSKATRTYSPISCGLSVGISPSGTINATADPKSLKNSTAEVERTPTRSFKRTLEESNSAPLVKKPKRSPSRTSTEQSRNLSVTPKRRTSGKLIMRRSLRGQKKLENPLIQQHRKTICVC
ncbi:protein phosphatase 1D [Pleurodeles waltl]|uniref:protein phosphatase 1D n=1 Tax=Pleurodeles waltl TaxID=8319 RepID=UPI003709B3FF